MAHSLDRAARAVFRATCVLCLSFSATGCDEEGLTAPDLQGGGLTGPATGAQPDAGGGTPLGEGMPCNVQQVVSQRCATCHGDPVAFGAPMSLVSQPHFMQGAPDSAGLTVAQSADVRINSTDPDLMMPPSTQAPLTPEEKAILQGWLDQGAPYVSESCGVAGGTGGTAGSTGGTAGTTGGTAGSTAGSTGGTAGTTGGWSTGGSGSSGDSGASTGATGGVPDDANLTCYRLTAHASGNADQKFEVGAATDRYVNFHFTAPWGNKTVYARTISNIIDNSQVLHHWLFFRNSFPEENLSVESSSGTHPDSELVYGWAPGGKDLNFYEEGDVGMEMPGDGNTSYTLELHYNSNDSSAVDASGLELCVSDEPPEDLAAQAWLGTDAISTFGLTINNMEASGTCNPVSDEPIHILSVSPHMHLKGVHMKAVINRANGSKETLHDGPFDFNDQTSYDKDVWIMPGDTITTTCRYSEPANFGEGTGDEMCYLFTMHTPAGTLTDNGPAGTAVHGSGACLGL